MAIRSCNRRIDLPRCQQGDENHEKTKLIEKEKQRTVDQAPENKSKTEEIEELKRKQSERS